MKKNLFNFSALFSFLSASSLFACSVCVGGYTQEKLDAYFITTIVLSGIPFLFGLTFYMIYRHYKKKARNLSAATALQSED